MPRCDKCLTSFGGWSALTLPFTHDVHTPKSVAAAAKKSKQQSNVQKKEGSGPDVEANELVDEAESALAGSDLRR